MKPSLTLDKEFPTKADADAALEELDAKDITFSVQNPMAWTTSPVKLILSFMSNSDMSRARKVLN